MLFGAFILYVGILASQDQVAPKEPEKVVEKEGEQTCGVPPKRAKIFSRISEEKAEKKIKLELRYDGEKDVIGRSKGNIIGWRLTSERVKKRSKQHKDYLLWQDDWENPVLERSWRYQDSGGVRSSIMRHRKVRLYFPDGNIDIAIPPYAISMETSCGVHYDPVGFGTKICTINHKTRIKMPDEIRSKITALEPNEPLAARFFEEREGAIVPVPCEFYLLPAEFRAFDAKMSEAEVMFAEKKNKAEKRQRQLREAEARRNKYR
jgi:hypothetical protein